MKKLITLLITLFATTVSAQHVEINTNYIQGIHYTDNWDIYGGGIELSAGYSRPIQNLDYSAVIGFRTVQWGTQLSLTLAATKTLAERFEVGANLENGMALFHQKKLYVIGGGLNGAYLFMKKKSVQMGVNLALRYTACPAYSNYSKIYTVTEIPVGIFVRF